MIKNISFNPLSGQFDQVSSIPQVSTDPISPAEGDMWVLRSGGSAGWGTEGEIKAFMGLGMPVPGTATSGGTYQLSYRTEQGTTIRVAMT